ncbi:AMP-binding protein [uncultured Acetobacteroides sp.]|uniref:AMP-dependent synthetase/ligase n=1 Tax=uncultured Acetobacteroides sp. TaxID=1760811 RepID=UPI0029F52E23|nr:AMP-binding protein [uncultured Acetobacteroides sp.]
MKTIIDLFEESVKKYPDLPYLWEKTNGAFKPTSYSQTKEQVRSFAAGLMAIGVEKEDKVAILAEGCNAWMISELGIFYAGAVDVPLSIKLEESSDLMFRLEHSESRFIVVSGNQLPKIRKIVGSLPSIRKVIVIDKASNLAENEILWDDVKRMGDEFLGDAANQEHLNERIASVKPESFANITYTSGTTADPKGIILTHGNYTSNVEQALSLMDIPVGYKTLLILPLDHCFAHVAGMYSFMACGASIGTVQVGRTPMETLKNIPINIKEFKPNLLLSVPALAKNFKKNIENGIRAKGKVTETLFKVGLMVAYAYNKEGFNKGAGLRFLLKPLVSLFDKIIFSKLREVFGGELDFFIGGGALLDIELQRFYYAIGIPMYQGYGLSEATPIISSNAAKKHKLGSSGFLVKPMELKIMDDGGNSLPVGEKGEIVIRGGNVMHGYWRNEKATAETVIDGWLHTGDMGYMDKDGFLYVMGRFKSLLIGSDGEKYSPEGIEEALVAHCKLVDQVILYNSQNAYTIALIVSNKEAMKRYVNSHQHHHKGWDSVDGKKHAIEELNKEIAQFRKGGHFAGMFPERWIPASFAILPEAFTEQNGMMNSTMKIVRGKVEAAYKDTIESMYKSNGKYIYSDYNIKSLS